MRRLRTGRLIEMTLSWSIIASTRSGQYCPADVTIECLPTSTLPAELCAAGYDLQEIGAGRAHPCKCHNAGARLNQQRRL